jgi:hypothetical protein
VWNTTEIDSDIHKDVKIRANHSITRRHRKIEVTEEKAKYRLQAKHSNKYTMAIICM